MEQFTWTPSYISHCFAIYYKTRYVTSCIVYGSTVRKVITWQVVFYKHYHYSTWDNTLSPLIKMMPNNQPKLIRVLNLPRFDPETSQIQSPHTSNCHVCNTLHMEEPLTDLLPYSWSLLSQMNSESTRYFANNTVHINLWVRHRTPKIRRRFRHADTWHMDRDSSVGIATRYVPDVQGIEFQWRRNFPQPSRPVLWSNQPPVKWVPGLFPGGSVAEAWLRPPMPIKRRG